MKDDISVELGKRIRKDRLKKNLSQEELASFAGVHRTYIGMVERGEKNLTLRNLKRIANALNTKISELLQNL